MVDEIEKRMKFNQQLREEKEQWWLEHNHQLFIIITGSMEKTNPGLRDLLRDRYHVQDGYYAGYDALEYVQAWLQSVCARQPNHAFYEKVLEHMVSHRLPEGASAKDFTSVVRRFTSDVNPFLRAPLMEEALGEFILEKLMPPYTDAIERILKELRKSDELSDATKVED